jgi:hypothetical protein
VHALLGNNGDEWTARCITLRVAHAESLTCNRVLANAERSDSMPT